MLTKILLAGLIPGVMAKPVALSSSSAKIPFSTAAAEKPKVPANQNKGLDGSYPVAAVPYAAVPLSSAVTSVSSAVSSISTVVLPSSLAVEDAPVVPVLSVASYPVAPVSAPVATVQSFPVQEVYVVKTPVVQPSLAVSTSSLRELPYSIKSPPVQVPVSTRSVAPTTLVQLPYTIKTPAVQVPVQSYPVASNAAAELPYGVKSAVPYAASSPVSVVAAVPYAASSPVSAVAAVPYAASSPASAVVAVPYAASSPAIAYAASSVAAVPYAASSPASAVVAVPYAASSPAIAYAASSPAVSALSAAATPYRASSAVSAPYGVASSAASPSEWQPDTVAPSAKDVCAQGCIAERCEDKKHHFAECKALCITDCKVNGPSDTASSKDKTTAKNPAIPDHGVTTPAIGAGELTWESCMEACDTQFQYTEVTGPTYNGNQKCVKQCAAYRRSGAELYEKREVEAIAERKVKSPPAEPKITAGTAAYEQCVKACSGKWQGTDAVPNTITGESSCASGCARKFLDGAEASVKRDVENIVEREAKKVAPKPAQSEIIAGTSAYEQCVKACNGKWQGTDAVPNTITGESSCASGCARKFLDGAEASVKRDIDVEDIVDKKREGIEAEVEAKTDALMPRKVKNNPPTGPSVFAGSAAFESCVKACKKKWQGTQATPNTYTGESHCAQSCSRGVKYGADAIVKRDAVPFPFEA